MSPGDTPTSLPQLSILIPMYNAAATIERTLRSLEVIPGPARDQVQIIIVNDGSTDDGRDRAAQVLLTLGFRHARLLDQENGGSASARNAAFAQAGGTWMLFLDADDELVINPLPWLEKHADASAVLFAAERVWHGTPGGVQRPPRIHAGNHLDLLTAKNPLLICSVIFRRQVVDQLFDTRVRRCEDWLFWLTNPLIFTRVVHLESIVAARIHIHGQNMSSQYATHGRYRSKVAQRCLAIFRRTLTPRQRNNFRIQNQIGRLQAGRRWRWRALATWPCDVHLYAKLCVYVAARLARLQATSYGSGR